MGAQAALTFPGAVAAPELGPRQEETGGGQGAGHWGGLLG